MIEHKIERATGEKLTEKLDDVVNKDGLEIMSVHQVGNDFWMILARKQKP